MADKSGDEHDEKQNSLLKMSEFHHMIVLLIDTSGSMRSSAKNRPIEQINTFFRHNRFVDASNDIVDIAVVGFDHTAYIAQEFSPLSKMPSLELTAEGMTAMGEGIVMAVNMIEERLKLYKEYGVPCYSPVILMITDGSPTDNMSLASVRVKDLFHKAKVEFWAAGIMGADTGFLKTLTKRVLFIDSEIISLNEFLDYFISKVLSRDFKARAYPEEYYEERESDEVPDGVYLIETDPKPAPDPVWFDD